MKTVSIANFKGVLDELKTECLAQGWTLINDVTKTDTYRDLVLRNSNGMYISLSEGYQQSTSGSKFLIVPNFFEAYNPALSSISANVGAFSNDYILTSSRVNGPITKAINNSMTMFMFITALKICYVLKTDQDYYFLYLGEGDRIGTYEQYKKPWICSSNVYANGSSALLSVNMFDEPRTIIKDINSVNRVVALKNPLSISNTLDNLNQNILVPIYLANGDSFVQMPKDCFSVSSITNLISENILIYNSIEYIVFRSSMNPITNNSYIAIKK